MIDEVSILGQEGRQVRFFDVEGRSYDVKIAGLRSGRKRIKLFVKVIDIPHVKLSIIYVEVHT